MPGRNGTGPLGQGSRTGRGMGNCKPANTAVKRDAVGGIDRPFRLGGRFWDSTFGRFLGRGRLNRSGRR